MVEPNPCCGNLLVIKMDDGNCMTQHLVCNGCATQEWGNLSARVSALMTAHHPAKEALAYALTNANSIDATLLAAGKNIDEVAVTRKRSVPDGNTALERTDIQLAEMADTDFVVSLPP